MAEEVVLLHLVAEVARDRDDRVAGDALERTTRERWRDEHAVLHDEQVLPGALRHEPLGVEQDRLVVARVHRLDLGQARVDVDARTLRRHRVDVRVHALPRGDLHAHARGQALLTEVGAPRPHRDRHVDRARKWVEPDLAVAEERDRPHVAGIEAALSHREPARVDQLVARVRDLHHDELGAVEQPLDVVRQAEHRGSACWSRRYGSPRRHPSRSAGSGTARGPAPRPTARARRPSRSSRSSRSA